MFGLASGSLTPLGLEACLYLGYVEEEWWTSRGVAAYQIGVGVIVGDVCSVCLFGIMLGGDL